MTQLCGVPKSIRWNVCQNFQDNSEILSLRSESEFTQEIKNQDENSCRGPVFRVAAQ